MDENPKDKSELTPEERLFKIIQEGESSKKDDTLLVNSEKNEPAVFKSDVLPDDLARNPVFNAGPAMVQAASPLFQIKHALENFFRNPFHQKPLSPRWWRFFSIRMLNRMLLAVLCALVLYFAGQIFFRKDRAAEFMKKNSIPASSKLEMPPEALTLGNVDARIQPLDERNAFHAWKPPAEAPAPQNPAPQAATSPSAALAQAMSTLKLSGIYLSEEPEALVEATDEKRTYAVAKGNVIKGLKVKEVKAEGVVFTDGQSERMLQ